MYNCNYYFQGLILITVSDGFLGLVRHGKWPTSIAPTNGHH